ncbi:MAG: ASPIC/UnbV domain-containing protein [Terracidiphilus sp.]
MSSNGLRVHFRLEDATIVESVEIRWRSGDTESIKPTGLDLIYIVTDGIRAAHSWAY